MRASEEVFYFKQFQVAHDRCLHKVGTDSVLLGAWVNVDGVQRILDVGSGSGLLALMMAQRTDAVIEGVEPDEGSFLQASENVSGSPWSQRIHLHHQSIQDFNSSVSFDLLICNPPYFVNSLRPPDAGREKARHTTTLSFQELLSAADRWLASDGRLCLVLPPTEGASFIKSAESGGLHCIRHWQFRTRPDKPVKRFLMEFSRIRSTPAAGEVVMYDEAGEASSAYQRYVQPFYL